MFLFLIKHLRSSRKKICFVKMGKKKDKTDLDHYYLTFLYSKAFFDMSRVQLHILIDQKKENCIFVWKEEILGKKEDIKRLRTL
jgi:hypothetical protein